MNIDVIAVAFSEQTDREKWDSPPTTYTTYVWAYEW